MAFIPISVDLFPDRPDRKGELYNYPKCEILGTALGTKYILKLQFKSSAGKRKNDCPNILTVQLERFCDLKSVSVHGSISAYSRTTSELVSQKGFKHSFRNGEKFFVFELVSVDVSKVISLHGHFCVDNSTDSNLTLDQKIAESCPLTEIHRSFSQLSSDFGYLIQDNLFSDITLKCGDVDIPAHRNILASRSPVFKAMLEKPMKENLTGEIQIEDIHPTTIKAMLYYVYCGKVSDFSEETACNLLYAADKYQLLELKEICVAHLKAAISFSNVFRILDVAVLHDDLLKYFVIDYIGANFSVIEKSEGWAKLKSENPPLVMDILTKIVYFGK